MSIKVANFKLNHAISKLKICVHRFLIKAAGYDTKKEAIKDLLTLLWVHKGKSHYLTYWKKKLKNEEIAI